MQTKTICVTDGDIKRGERNASARCPIALAVKRALGIDWGCYVYDETIEIVDNESRLPSRATNFVHRFDKGIPVKPFSFKLELHEPA